jgi:hypothetical protein
MKHAEPGAYASAPSMGPGSYWFQPANQPHVGISATRLSDTLSRHLPRARRDMLAPCAGLR